MPYHYHTVSIGVWVDAEERRMKGRREGEKREAVRREEEFVNNRKSRRRSVEKEKWGEEG